MQPHPSAGRKRGTSRSLRRSLGAISAAAVAGLCAMAPAVAQAAPQAPALTVNANKISWSSQSEVTSYTGATSDAARSTTSRTTNYQSLGNVTSWSPTPQPGKTLYYGVAANGATGGAWSSNEVSIAWPSAAPVLTLNGRTISWPVDSSATSFTAAISTAARGATGRTTTYQSLGNVTSWTPTAQPGQTLYYGISSNGANGGQWSASEAAITWPAQPVAPVLTLTGTKVSWPAQSAVTAYTGAISNGPRSNTSRTTSYVSLGNVTGWTPPASCGQTLYYGVATSTGQWSSSEMSITWPACGGTGGGGTGGGGTGGGGTGRRRHGRRRQRFVDGRGRQC